MSDDTKKEDKKKPFNPVMNMGLAKEFWQNQIKLVANKKKRDKDGGN